MRRVPRLLLAMPLLLALATATGLCVNIAAAALIAAQGDYDALSRALSLTPNDPSLHERLGITLARTAASPEEARVAIEHLRKALELRPTSAYAWALLAETRYRLGVADETFDLALVRAEGLGPNEPPVQESVVLYGLAQWASLSPAARAAVDRAIAAGVRRDPAAMLRIAQRRGRLDAVCAHVDASMRRLEESVPLCKAAEPRS